MASHLVNATDEAAIWARLMENHGAEPNRAAAEYLLSIRFPEKDELRMSELGARSNAGTITEQELAELDSYLHVGNLLAVVQARARAVLRRSDS